MSGEEKGNSPTCSVTVFVVVHVDSFSLSVRRSFLYAKSILLLLPRFEAAPAKTNGALKVHDSGSIILLGIKVMSGSEDCCYP